MANEIGGLFKKMNESLVEHLWDDAHQLRNVRTGEPVDPHRFPGGEGIGTKFEGFWDDPNEVVIAEARNAVDVRRVKLYWPGIAHFFG